MGVKDKGLWERFLYRYTYIDTVEREGKLYKKYEKIPRFKNPRRVLNVVVVLLLIVVISSFVIYLTHIANEGVFSGQ